MGYVFVCVGLGREDGTFVWEDFFADTELQLLPVLEMPDQVLGAAQAVGLCVGTFVEVAAHQREPEFISLIVGALLSDHVQIAAKIVGFQVEDAVDHILNRILKTLKSLIP